MNTDPTPGHRATWHEKQFAWLGYPTEPVRTDMCDWFTRHGIDPNQVPGDWGRVSRHCLPDLPGISLEMFVRGTSGGWAKNEAGDDVKRETVWIPMEADPLPFPASIYPAASTTGGRR